MLAPTQMIFKEGSCRSASPACPTSRGTSESIRSLPLLAISSVCGAALRWYPDTCEVSLWRAWVDSPSFWVEETSGRGGWSVTYGKKTKLETVFKKKWTETDNGQKSYVNPASVIGLHYFSTIQIYNSRKI